MENEGLRIERAANGMTEECMNTILPLKKLRGRWEIIFVILEVTPRDRKKNKITIMEEAYLDRRTFNKYLDYLLKEGFLEECKGKEYLRKTEKGTDLLKRLNDLEKVLDQTRSPNIFFPLGVIMILSSWVLIYSCSFMNVITKFNFFSGIEIFCSIYSILCHFASTSDFNILSIICMVFLK